jgi:phenylpropionate dioxygenase-like ring-hydroxylating dioxygenase large terminal subunit
MTRASISAAPLDRSALERVLLPFGPSRLLPQEAYTSREVLDWEQRHLFEGSWACAGTAEALQHPGDQRAVRVGGDGILLVRGEDGALRGFYNVCRHRAHELLPPGGCRTARSIRCPYHGWTYGLDGGLRQGSDQAGFDPGHEGLVPARVQEWGAWIFVNLSGDAPAFPEWIGSLDELTRNYDCSRLRAGASHVYEIPANWKLVVENYDECYHCPQIHPQLCKVSPPESGDNPERRGAFVGGSMDLVKDAVTMSLDGHSDGVPIAGLSAAQLREVSYFSLFPNLLLSLHPDYVMTHRMEPLSPSRTRIECQWLFPPEALTKPGFDPRYAVEFWDMTNQQDWHAVESVQRGIESRGYRPGTLHSQEDAVYQFVTRMARAYLEGRFDPEPRTLSPGHVA